MSVSSTEAVRVSQRPLPDAQRAVQLSPDSSETSSIAQVHAGREGRDPWWVGDQLGTVKPAQDLQVALLMPDSIVKFLATSSPIFPSLQWAVAILAPNKGLESMSGC